MALVSVGLVLVKGMGVATDNKADTASNLSTPSNNPRRVVVWVGGQGLLLVIIQSSTLHPNPVLTRFSMNRCRCRSFGRSARRRRHRRRI